MKVQSSLSLSWPSLLSCASSARPLVFGVTICLHFLCANLDFGGADGADQSGRVLLLRD
jgi:hypothetical protein